MPSWGRPPGAKGSRRRRQWEWEQEQAYYEEQARIEELGSDDTDSQGVSLEYSRKRFAGDPQRFAGSDMGDPRARKGYAYDEESDESDSEDESEEEEGGATTMVVALRDKEEALVQSAEARIRRAQVKGKREVKLNKEELDALNARRKRLEAEAEAAKDAAAKDKKKKKSGSPRGSGTDRRPKKDNKVTVPIPSTDSSKKSSKSKKSETTDRSPSEISPPGFLVTGPDGPMYAPIPSQTASPKHRGSPGRPSPGTVQRVSTYFSNNAPGSPGRNSDGSRPASSASSISRRPLPDEEGWNPNPAARARWSSASMQPYGSDSFEYMVPENQYEYAQPPPGRRTVTGPPPDVSYSAVRRSLPTGASYTASRLSRHESQSPRADSLQSRSQSSSGTSSSSEDSGDGAHGVQVAVEVEESEPEQRKQIARKPVHHDGRRKRKSKGK